MSTPNSTSHDSKSGRRAALHERMPQMSDARSPEGDLMKGFSKLSRDERFARLIEMGALTEDDVKYLKSGGLRDFTLAESFIENVIGYFQLPLGVATNFVIDGRELVIPMAVEETSIIAAASKSAKWVRERGEIRTSTLGDLIIGQIQVAHVSSYESFAERVMSRRDEFVQLANRDVAHGLVARGGGVREISVRRLARPDGGDMAVVHVLADPCDAMGANIINQVCEYLKAPIETLTGERVTMCILSNLVDTKLTRAEVCLRGLEPDLARRIEEASLFAWVDPYRAATNNKGVMNGIDPILIATGNDWRAVEAGVHAYAVRDGQYRSITRWQVEGDELVGVFEAPIVVGTVGGVTRLHPTARMALEMLGVESAAELSRICAAVGLVQNLGALKALTTVGIIEGHMKLHIRNLTIGAGATEVETPIVQKRLEEILLLTKRISLQNAIEVLREIRTAARAGEASPGGALS
ncbi:MAG TPA: hydroxymethylglutaryl-CoA reductase, degradative [Pseudobdellovibrionaceae bacterium]|nr:hydroxymethylglutaryl-CoA reductase, degradative [Pseudobdellovibrionaceae bacterium]